MEHGNPPKKKRGRKPKKTIQKIENTNKLLNNMVIKLNHSQEENSVVVPFTNDNFYSNESTSNNCGKL